MRFRTTVPYLSQRSLQQRELTLKEECAYRDSLQSKFESEQRRVQREAGAYLAAKENTMRIDFEENINDSK